MFLYKTGFQKYRVSCYFPSFFVCVTTALGAFTQNKQKITRNRFIMDFIQMSLKLYGAKKCVLEFRATKFKWNKYKTHNKSVTSKFSPVWEHRTQLKATNQNVAEIHIYEFIDFLLYWLTFVSEKKTTRFQNVLILILFCFII